MSRTKKGPRKARFAAQHPARRQRAIALRVWVVAGVAMAAVLVLAGFLFLQPAKPSQAAVRLASDAKVGDAHTFYSPT